MTGRVFLLALMLVGVLGPVAHAEGAVEVGASLDRDRAAVGEQVQLIVSVSGEARDVMPPQLPELAQFRSFGGGQSQKFSFVNGKVSAQHTYTFYLQPQSEGEFTIGSILVRVDGTDYRTTPLKLTVTAQSAQGGVPVPQQPDDGPDAEGDAAGDRDVFVTMSVDEDSVFVGEQVVLTFAFYRSLRMSGFASPEYSAPRTEGFWREDLPPERNSTRVIRSRRYNVTEISYALFPTRAGELTIGEATVRMPDDLFDAFFRRSRQPRRGPRVLQTEPITVHVKRLPSPAPEGFDGAVAENLTLRASVDRQELDEGDAMTLSMRLSGEGHITGLAAPEIEESDDFRIHDAGGGAESRPQGGRLVGSKLTEQLLMPKRAGRLEIPAVTYTYFDPSRSDYVTLRSEPIEVMVRAVEGGVSSAFTGGRKNEIELLSRDILYIVPISPGATSWPGPLPVRPVFWAVITGPALLWLGSLGLARRREQMRRDPRRMRARAALATAKRQLVAEGAADQRVIRAVHGFIADRFDRAAAGLTHDEAQRLLEGAGVSRELVSETRVVLETCDAARYAPVASGETSLVDRASALLDRLEKEVGREV